jgi:16S rRNA (uracil1498-N3)-methyltransferase
MTHRFFVSPDCIADSNIILRDEAAYQINTVLRMRPGSEIELLTNNGQAYTVQLTALKKGEVTGQIISRRSAGGEPATQLTLFQATLKAQKFEWVLQKGTELGITHFVPVIFQRSIVREKKAILKKEARRLAVIREAAEQSGRGRLPTLAPPVTLDEALRTVAGGMFAIMPWEEERVKMLKTVLAHPARQLNIGIFIGPEGGITPDEAELASRAGVQLITLGPRILRAETAGLALSAAILYTLGEWEPSTDHFDSRSDSD